MHPLMPRMFQKELFIKTIRAGLGLQPEIFGVSFRKLCTTGFTTVNSMSPTSNLCVLGSCAPAKIHLH